MAVLGLHYCKGLSLTGSERALLLITVRSLLLFWSSGFSSCSSQVLEHRLSSCSPQA